LTTTVALLTSGGDGPGMNAALRAAAKTASARGASVLGVLDGYDGLIDGRFVALGRSASDGDPFDANGMDFVARQGGTVLGTARSERFRTPEGRARAAEQLRTRNVSGLLVVGGNGSLTGAHVLAGETGIQVMGVPGSIDNDIGCTSTCIGVDTALNTIVEACDRISDTARSHRRAFVVEVMGRQSGYLAMAGAVAVGADAVVFREQQRDEAALVQAVAEVIRRGFAERGKRRVLILKAEGVEIPTLRLVRLVEEVVKPGLPDLETRGVVLGHVVRGGNPSFLDRMVAARLAFAAISALLDGATDEMVAWQAPLPGGIATPDASVKRFPLAMVLEETARLLDGTSPVTQRRVGLMSKVEGVLQL
jgi:6-phosphofructokinase 1